MDNIKPKRTRSTPLKTRASSDTTKKRKVVKKTEASEKKVRTKKNAHPLIEKLSEEKSCLFCQTPKKEGLFLKDHSFLCADCQKKINAIKHTDYSLKEKQKHKLLKADWNKRKTNFFQSTEPLVEKENTSKIYLVDAILLGATGLALTQEAMGLACVAILIAIFWYIYNSMKESQEKLRVVETNRKRQEAAEKERQNWLKQNPEPPSVILEKHAQASSDRLTPKDQLVLSILQNLPNASS